MQLIDTHTHLTAPEYGKNLEAVLKRSRLAGVNHWITVGTNLSDSAAAVQLCKKHEGMYCTVGIHPHEAGEQEARYIENMRRLTVELPVRAMGELGLDYYYDFSPPAAQREVFEEQLTLAGEIGLPVVVHCRKALQECLSILEAWGRDDVPVVFHCFSGDKTDAKEIIERGYFISFTGMITFAKAAEVQEAAAYVPLERVFLETDCPYLSPEPKRRIKPNEPAFLTYTAEKLAELRDVNMYEIAQVTTHNCRLFFGLDT